MLRPPHPKAAVRNLTPPQRITHTQRNCTPPPQVTLVGKVVHANESGGGIDLQLSDGTGVIDVRVYAETDDVSLGGGWFL